MRCRYRLTRLEELVATANSRVHATSVGGGATMGTTLVGVVLFDNAGDDGLVVMNVGDSRCYVYDERFRLRRLTTDHSVVQEMIDAGSLTSGQAASHPERNVVTRVIGIEPAVAADFTVLKIEHDTRLLLCSDGVSGQLGDDELLRMLSGASSPQDAVDQILDTVLRGSAPDNATAVVIDVEPRGSTEGDHVAADDDITGPSPLRAPTDTAVPVTAVPHAPALIDSVPSFGG